MNPHLLFYIMFLSVREGEFPLHWFEIETAFAIVEQEIRWKSELPQTEALVPIKRGEAFNESAALSLVQTIVNPS